MSKRPKRLHGELIQNSPISHPKCHIKQKKRIKSKKVIKVLLCRCLSCWKVCSTQFRIFLLRSIIFDFFVAYATFASKKLSAAMKNSQFFDAYVGDYGFWPHHYLDITWKGFDCEASMTSIQWNRTCIVHHALLSNGNDTSDQLKPNCWIDRKMWMRWTGHHDFEFVISIFHMFAAAFAWHDRFENMVICRLHSAQSANARTDGKWSSGKTMFNDCRA